jgi:tetratricopeptide (TPR) repeat protein
VRREVRDTALSVDELLRDLDRALSVGEEPRRLVPQLVELARLSAVGSDAWLFAHRQLAATAAETDPWQASLLARRLLDVSVDDHAAWGALGLAQSLLGNLRFAVRCYEKARALAPHETLYLHNLGHLYDAGVNRPDLALPLLAEALGRLGSTPRDPRSLRTEVAASYAHALARAGKIDEARQLLATALARGKTRDQAKLQAWIERGAPR